MKVEYTEISGLPLLAWVAQYSFGADRLSVRHGSKLETNPKFFVEGCWNGDFSRGNFDNSDVFYGTGAVIENDSLVFVSSLSTTECLYYHADQNDIYVSNSLPLILAARNDSLGSWTVEYIRGHMSLGKGIKNFEKDIKTIKGSIQRTIFFNIKVSGHRIEFVEKKWPPSFQSYDQYKEYLSGCVGDLLANARCADRKYPLKIYSTQSRGYDTTAVNAVAAPYGIDAAFTCPSSKETSSWAGRGNNDNNDDDGTEICEQLGIPSHRIDRLHILHHHESELFLNAGAPNCDSANFIEIGNYATAPAVMLTGNLGEIWYPYDRLFVDKHGIIDDELKKRDVMGISEWRLKAGLIHVPIPYIGARRRQDIYNITLSAEMDHWRVPGEYDRPIPRRLAEEAGIDRSMFGMKKMATVVKLPMPMVPLDGELRNEFFEFLKVNKYANPLEISLIPLAQYLNRRLYYRTPFTSSLFYKYKKLMKMLVKKDVDSPMILKKLNGVLYVFSVEKLKNEFSALINTKGY